MTELLRLQIGQDSLANLTFLSPTLPTHPLPLSLLFFLQIDQAEVAEFLSGSPWQFRRDRLRFVAVIGEGNFGKVT